MRRKRFQKKPVAVAMLPFLAVLICTMGSLILLLVILVQSARVEADTVKSRRQQEQEQESEQGRALREQTEDAQWRKELLLAARQENTQKLTDARLELSHLEDHLRRLQTKWQELTRQVEDLQRLSGDKQADTSAAEAELARLSAEIQQEQQRLEQARRAAADRPRSFAIVPVPRTNGTLRRPIYIECTANGVILQPEGIVLNAKDFLPPLGPGNALDAALRATREYLAQHGGVDAHGEPYPLMLVRPNGAIAYAAARDALRSWEHEFGYELLDENMELAYPQADPALAELIRRAVEMARRRQELLARSAPTRFRQLRQAMQTGDGPGDSLLGGGGPGVGGVSDRPGSSDGIGLGDSSQGEGTFPGGGPQGANAQNGGGGGAIGQSPRPGQDTSLGQGASGQGGAGGQGFAAGQNGGANRGGPAQQGASGGNPNGGGFYGSGLSRESRGSRDGGRGAGAAQRRPGGGQPGPGGNSTGSGSSTANGDGPGGPLEGDPSMQSMASQRGSNWALRDRGASRANAYTRPVRVTITPDRLYILSDNRGGQPVQTIELRGATHQHVESLVEAVQQQIDGWGTAPVRGYWRPVLTVQVVPGAERRYNELRLLLDDSGLEVERKAP
ncbi:MAG: hypothetical protein RIC55_21845 [Pirellulaceae bacterium]